MLANQKMLFFRKYDMIRCKKEIRSLYMAEQELAMQVLQQVVKLPVVKVDRSKFLVDKFSNDQP